MKEKFYASIVRHPWIVITTVLVLTVYSRYRFPNSNGRQMRVSTCLTVTPRSNTMRRWKNIFGVKDAIIIGIVNKKGDI